MPAKLNLSQPRRYAGGKDSDEQCCRLLLFSEQYPRQYRRPCRMCIVYRWAGIWEPGFSLRKQPALACSQRSDCGHGAKRCVQDKRYLYRPAILLLTNDANSGFPAVSIRRHPPSSCLLIYGNTNIRHCKIRKKYCHPYENKRKKKNLLTEKKNNNKKVKNRL